MKLINNTTLVCVDCYNYGGAITAIKKSLEQIDFEKKLFLTDIPIEIDGIEIIQIPKIKSKKEYSEFIIKKLSKYITTDYLLIIQSDGYIIDGEQWDDNYFKYDYIGASWIYDNDRQVGNGGFSLRTKKLHDILANDDLIDVLHPEDQSICILYKFYLEEKYKIKFAPVELADKFSYELKEPIQKTFGFHGYFHQPFKKIIVIRRMAAMGDVIQVEPVLEHFNNLGYRVVLDTLPKFKQLFYQHYFKVEFLDEIDKRLPYIFYNLDLSYESKPKQLHLKTYYEFCNVKDGKLKNPKLNLFNNYRNEIKLFKKYAIIHIDNREQPHRNIYGINWERICRRLYELGYSVIQLGKDSNCEIMNAIKMNTPNEQFLMWVVASSDLFIGIDSGISNIASGFNIPSVIFFGSVNPKYIHADLSNKLCITNQDKKVCDTPYCWHNSVTTIGQDCVINKQLPPCVLFDTQETLSKIENFINNVKNRTN